MSYIYDKTKKQSNDIVASQLQFQKNINERLDGLSIDVLTKAEFDAISNKNSNVIYIVSNGNTYTVYKGNVQISGTGGEYVVVEHGLYLQDYDSISSSGGISGEGDAYARNHTILYTPDVSPNNISIKDGGAPTRFIPSVNSYYRCLLGDVTNGIGRCSDGRASISFNVYREIGGAIARETLSYRIRTYEELIGQEDLGESLWAFDTRVSYCVECTRTRNGVSKTWLYTAKSTPSSYTAMDFRASTEVGSSADTSARHWFPILTLGFEVSDLDDIYSAAPKLIYEMGGETITEGTWGNTISERGIKIFQLTESSEEGHQLGILYDPDTKQPFEHAPKIASSAFRPYGNYLKAAKIAGYTSEKDVT